MVSRRDTSSHSNRRVSHSSQHSARSPRLYRRCSGRICRVIRVRFMQIYANYVRSDLQSRACDIINEAYSSDEEIAKLLLHRPFTLFGGINAMQMARLAKANVICINLITVSRRHSGIPLDNMLCGNCLLALERRYKFVCGTHPFWTISVLSSALHGPTLCESGRYKENWKKEERFCHSPTARPCHKSNFFNTYGT